MNLRSAILTIILLVAIPFASPGISQTTTEADSVGWIEEIQQPAYLRSAETAKSISLDTKRDRYRRLYVGDRVRCDHDGHLKLQLYGRIIELKESKTWFPIPRVASKRSDLQRALESYGRVGGRDRGFQTIF